MMGLKNRHAQWISGSSIKGRPRGGFVASVTEILFNSVSFGAKISFMNHKAVTGSWVVNELTRRVSSPSYFG